MNTTATSKKNKVVATLSTAVSIAALFLAHTMYVTLATYAWGAVIVVALAVSIFVRRRIAPDKSRGRWIVSILCAVNLFVLLVYVLGIASWFK